jgi:tRNA A22 N-methylase
MVQLETTKQIRRNKMKNDFEITNEGSLEDRYQIYVDCMRDLGKPYKTFEEWLGV